MLLPPRGQDLAHPPHHPPSPAAPANLDQFRLAAENVVPTSSNLEPVKSRMMTRFRMRMRMITRMRKRMRLRKRKRTRTRLRKRKRTRLRAWRTPNPMRTPSWMRILSQMRTPMRVSLFPAPFFLFYIVIRNNCSFLQPKPWSLGPLT